MSKTDPAAVNNKTIDGVTPSAPATPTAAATRGKTRRRLATGAPDFRERMGNALLEATERMIATEGWTSVQARRISTEVGCAIGTIYNLFDDLDGLILAANLRTLSALAERLRDAEAKAAGQDLETRLTSLALAYLAFAETEQRRWRAVFEHRPPDTCPVPAAYFEDRRALLGMIERQLADAMPTANDEIRQDAARGLFSATHGNVLIALDAKLGPYDAAACERQIRFLVRHVVAGLSAQSGQSTQSIE